MPERARTWACATLFLMGWLAVLFMLALALIAAHHDGTAWVKWDRYGEMWVEVGALVLIAALYPFALWFTVRKS